VHLRVCTRLAATAEVVWSVLEPIERHVDWMADALEITFVGDRRRGVGTTFDCRTRVGPFRTTDRMVVTEWEPGRALGIVHGGAVRGSGRFSLDADATGTTFCWDETLVLPWWLGARAGEALARPILRAIWTRNLARLARLVDAAGA
jgi:hypothetical protein